jgi:hypothetical protein
LARSDPATYEEQKYAFEQWHALKGAFDEWRGKVVQEREQESVGKRAEVAKAEGRKFLEAFESEVQDEATFTAKISELQAYAQSQGYQPPEINGMIDHRAYVILDKARKFDAMMAKNKPTADLKVKKAKLKTVSSGSAQRKPKRSSERDQAHNRFIQSTSRSSHTMSRKEQIEAAVDAMTAGGPAKD